MSLVRPPAFLANRPRLAAFATLATFSSGFGQTFFVAVFGGELRAAFELSHTAYGSLYGAATVIAAVVLPQAGIVADRWPLRRAVVLAAGTLATGCVVLGSAEHFLVLGLAFLLIRFAGQGLIAHLGLTVAGRYFHATRGKAMALAAAGFPLAEAVLPATAVALMTVYGWRMPWLLAGAVTIAGTGAALYVLARHAPHPDEAAAEQAQTAGERQYTRREALRDPGLWMLLPATLATPFVVTGVLFHQSAIAEAQGWPMAMVARAFTGFAAGHLLALLAAGPLVDRLGAQRALPVTLAPMATGLILLALSTDDWIAFAYLALVGTTMGLFATAGGALWAERYGVQHLGAIRALAQAAMILTTSVAPLLLGLMLDRGVTVTALGTLLAACVAAAALLAAAAPATVREPKGQGG